MAAGRTTVVSLDSETITTLRVPITSDERGTGTMRARFVQLEPALILAGRIDEF